VKNVLLMKCRARSFLAFFFFAALFPSSAEAQQNHVLWTTNFYQITGATLPELRQSIRQTRPWKDRNHFDGWTEWKIEWRFNIVQAEGGWRCNSFTTTTTLKTTLPQWRPPSDASPTVKHLWLRYITALGQHEAGHAQLALAAAAEQHRRVKEIGIEPDAATLKKKINDLARSIVDDCQRKNEEYDRRTQHGVSQGAFLPSREP
jgi:predicted secreted Zn-dependent protease